MNGYTALTYCQSGGGKTFNALRLPGQKIMLSSDRSYNFAAKGVKDLEIMDITRWLPDKAGKEKCFQELFDQAVAKKPVTIIIDNLSDLIDMAVLELIGSDGASKDNRQSYQAVYMAIRRLTRSANYVGCNVLYTAWLTVSEITMPDGTVLQRFAPKLPAKITDNVCGLCNMVAYIGQQERNGQNIWYYDMRGTNVLLAKDQVWGRKVCAPDKLFSAPEAKKGAAGK